MALTGSFETGISGNSVTTGDVGSADAWDVVQIDANAILKYDAAHKYDNLAAKITSGASPTNAYVGWTTKWGTQTDHYGRVYIYPSTLWAVDTFLSTQRVSGNATDLVIGASNEVQLRDSAGVMQATSTNDLTLNAWNRIEWHFVHSTTAGQMQIKLFLGANADGTTPDETVTTASNINTNSSSDAFYVGLRNNDPSITFWIDNIIGAATSYPGPASLSRIPNIRTIRSNQFRR